MPFVGRAWHGRLGGLYGREREPEIRDIAARGAECLTRVPAGAPLEALQRSNLCGRGN
jgi:hypothetical protein